MQDINSRPTSPFTIFYRTGTGEGGYVCRTCSTRRHDRFARPGDAFAVASQHLNVCRAALRHRPLEGTAILDGTPHGVVLRDGIMVLVLCPLFASSTAVLRVVA